MNKSFIFFGLLALVYLTGCHSQTEEKEITGTFKVTSPAEKDTTIYKEYVCQIRAIQHIELRALEKGYLQNIYVDEGQYVHKGQLLFRLNAVVYNAETQKAGAEVNAADIEYRNTKLLADSNIVSQNELALSKAKLDQSKASLQLAKAHLGFTEIRAPFDGIIGRFNDVRLGSLLDEGELLTTLSDNNNLWVYFNLPEAEYLDYKALADKGEQKRVKLKMANNEEFGHDGVIETMEADFNNENGNIAFRAKFPNPGNVLRHGETGTILMPTTLKKAIIIPQESTFDILDKKFVYVVDSKGVLTSRQITVGVEMPHLYTVAAGLKSTDKILLEGLGKVKNNETIKTQFIPFEQAFEALNNLHAE